MRRARRGLALADRGWPLILRVDDALHGTLRVGALRVRVEAQRVGHAALAAEFVAAADRVRAAWRDVALSSVPGIAAVRALHRALGGDPRRHPPWSESLVRRALNGHLALRGDAIADVLALIALRERLPVLLYDGSGLADPIEVRLGRAGETYSGAAGPIPVERRVALCAHGLPFGSPLGDEGRPRVAPAPGQDLLLLLLTPPDAETQRIEGALAQAERDLERHLGTVPAACAVAPQRATP